MLLELVSCGLHVLHGAYQSAPFKTDWNLDKVLIKFYSILKKSNAKRSCYIKQMIYRNLMKANPRRTYSHSNIVGIDGLVVRKQLND